jgi:hypothetical protein
MIAMATHSTGELKNLARGRFQNDVQVQVQVQVHVCIICMVGVSKKFNLSSCGKTANNTINGSRA